MMRLLCALALMTAPAAAQSGAAIEVFRAEGEGWSLEFDEDGERAVGFAAGIGAFEVTDVRPRQIQPPGGDVTRYNSPHQNFWLTTRTPGCGPGATLVRFGIHDREYRGCGALTDEPLDVISGDDWSFARYYTRFALTMGGETVTGRLNGVAYPAYYGETYDGAADDGRLIGVALNHEGCEVAPGVTGSRADIWFDGAELTACGPAPSR